MGNPSEYLRGYILREGILLTLEQFEAAYSAFVSMLTTDFKNVKTTCNKLFGRNMLGKEDNKGSTHYYCTCCLCNQLHSADRKKNLLYP